MESKHSIVDVLIQRTFRLVGRFDPSEYFEPLNSLFCYSCWYVEKFRPVDNLSCWHRFKHYVLTGIYFFFFYILTCEDPFMLKLSSSGHSVESNWLSALWAKVSEFKLIGDGKGSKTRSQSWSPLVFKPAPHILLLVALRQYLHPIVLSGSAPQSEEGNMHEAKLIYKKTRCHNSAVIALTRRSSRFGGYRKQQFKIRAWSMTTARRVADVQVGRSYVVNGQNCVRYEKKCIQRPENFTLKKN